MIGGEDIVIELPGGADEPLRRHVLKYFAERWSNLVVERGDADVLQQQTRGWLKELADADEVFLYPDKEAYESWTENGATEDNYNQMLHVIWRAGGMTLVVDDANEQNMRELLDEVRQTSMQFQAAFFARAA